MSRTVSKFISVPVLMVGLSQFMVAPLRDEQLKNRASYPLTPLSLR